MIKSQRKSSEIKSREYNKIETQSEAKVMSSDYIKLCTTTSLPFMPIAAYDSSRRILVHLYEYIQIEASTFQEDVSRYMARIDSYTNNVVAINKLKDERIKFKDGIASIQVTVVTDYVPWRLHQYYKNITYEQGLFLLEGALKGFRQILHRLKTPFLIDRFMIGVDAYGEVKVWWNEHFFKNNFAKAISTNMKLKEMIMSLVNCLAIKMKEVDATIFKSNLLLVKEVTFVEMESKIKEMAFGLDLRVIGRKLIQQDTEVSSVKGKVKKIIENSLGESQLFQSRATKSVIVPQTPKMGSLDDALVTKRTYKDGTSPSELEKLNIMKFDIERLRLVKNEREEPISKLKMTKSLSNIVSINKGLFGDESIPEVKNAMKYSTVLDEVEKPTVSLFAQAPQYQSQFITSQKEDPENCGVCSGINNLRRSQTLFESELFLSKVKSQHNLTSSRTLFSTDGSTSGEKLKNSFASPKFGESDKKLPSSYFGSLMI